MIRVAINRLLLLLLGLQLVVPAALWHGLDHHHDSVECSLPVEGLVVSEAHIHCLALDLVLAVSCLNSPPQFSFNTEIPSRLVRFVVAVPVLTRIQSVFLRGPPAL
jgi:hypothetical protein